MRDRGTGFEKLPCQIAAVVPEGRREDGGWVAREWLAEDGEICAVWCCGYRRGLGRRRVETYEGGREGSYSKSIC